MNFFADVFTRALNLLLPPTCVICQTRMMESNTLCPDCYDNIEFIMDPVCSCCGHPFGFDTHPENLCGACLQKKRPYDKARSAFLYDDFSKQLILPFKHGDKIEHLPLLVKMMETAGRDLIPETDIVIPVPLHRLRLLKRKYNQSALLAQTIAKRNDKTYLPNTLKRIKHTKSQGHLSTRDRKKNLSQAFKINTSDKIKGKNILLIDDVMTSGATMNECTKILRKSGAKKIFILTLCRV